MPVRVTWTSVRVGLWVLWGLGIAFTEPLALSALGLGAALAWGSRSAHIAGRILAGIGDLLGATVFAATTGIALNGLVVLAVIIAVGHGWAGGAAVGGVMGLLVAILTLTFTRLLALSGAAATPDALLMLFGAALGAGVGALAHHQARRQGSAFDALPWESIEFPFAIWWFRDGVLQSATRSARAMSDRPEAVLRLPPLKGVGEAQIHGRGGPGNGWSWVMWRWRDQDGAGRAVVLAARSDATQDYEGVARAGAGASRLLAELAHEIKNPVAIIHSSLGMLDGDALDPEDRLHLTRTARVASDRLVSLLGSVSALGRLAGGAHELMDWAAIQREVQEIATAHEAVLEIRTPVEAPSVLWDREGGMRCLTNLVRNAARAVPATGGSIRLTVAIDGAQVRFVVEDNGPGLPAHCLPLDGPLTRESGTGGEGIGLGIAVRTVMLMGGSLHYEDAGPGARFVLTMPVSYSTASLEERAPG